MPLHGPVPTVCGTANTGYEGIKLMRNWIILAVVVVAGAGIWLFTQPEPAPQVVEEVTAPTPEPAVPAENVAEQTVEETIEDNVEAAEDSASEAAEAVDTATEEAAVAAQDAIDTATQTANDLAVQANDALNDAATSIGDAITDAANSLETAVDTATGQTETPAELTGEGVSELDASEAGEADVAGDQTTDEATASTDLSDLLTLEGFDYDAVIEYIDQSDMSLLIKSSTKVALEQARDNPEQLRGVLEALREQLGV